MIGRLKGEVRSCFRDEVLGDNSSKVDQVLKLDGWSFNGRTKKRSRACNDQHLVPCYGASLWINKVHGGPGHASIIAAGRIGALHIDDRAHSFAA